MVASSEYERASLRRSALLPLGVLGQSGCVPMVRQIRPSPTQNPERSDGPTVVSSGRELDDGPSLRSGFWVKRGASLRPVKPDDGPTVISSGRELDDGPSLRSDLYP